MADGLSQQSKHKYRIISEELRDKIFSGRYAPGETLPSQHALMNQYQVSQSTVRQSLGELAREGLVRPERGRGFFVEQIDGALPRVTKRRAGKIGFICCEQLGHEASYLMMVNGASEELQAVDETVAYTWVGYEDAGSMERCARLARDLDGVIVTGFVDPRALRDCLAGDTKIVILGDLVVYEGIEPFNWVNADAHSAGYMAAQMLLMAGHERIGLVTSLAGTKYFEHLEQGLSDACRYARLSEPVVYRVKVFGNAAEEERIAGEIVSSGSVTGLAVIGDDWAARQVAYLRERGWRTPEDISVVGVGGLPRSTLAVPGLSRIDIGYQRMGTEAARLLLNGSSQVVHKLLPVRIDRGETIAPPRRSNN